MSGTIIHRWGKIAGPFAIAVVRCFCCFHAAARPSVKEILAKKKIETQKVKQRQGPGLREHTSQVKSRHPRSTRANEDYKVK